jgi:hypothetical protein
MNSNTYRRLEDVQSLLMQCQLSGDCLSWPHEPNSPCVFVLDGGGQTEPKPDHLSGYTRQIAG